MGGEASTESKLRFKLTATTNPPTTSIPWVTSQEGKVRCEMAGSDMFKRCLDKVSSEYKASLTAISLSAEAGEGVVAQANDKTWQRIEVDTQRSGVEVLKNIFPVKVATGVAGNNENENCAARRQSEMDKFTEKLGE